MSQTTTLSQAQAPFRLEITYPKINDARWLLLAFLISYVAYAINSIGYTRTPIQFLASVTTCLVLDSLFLYFKKLPLVPLSGFITSMGITLLCDSPHVWPYVVVAALSIGSKHLITASNGRHIFNPNNFGVIVGVLYLNEFMTITAGRWGGFTALAVVVSILGCTVAYRARRLTLALTYVVTFLVGVGVRALILKRPLMAIAAPMTGAAFQLFVFYMITDPLTTPRTWKGQLAFGIGLGALDTILRYNQMKYAPFLSLFVLCAVYAFIEELKGTERLYPWSLGKFKFAAR